MERTDETTFNWGTEPLERVTCRMPLWDSQLSIYNEKGGGRKKKSHSGDSLIMRRQHSGLNFDQSAFVRAWPSSSALMCPEPSLSTARNHCSTCGSTGCWWPRPAEYAMGHLSHATTNDFKEDTSQDYAISTHNLYRNVHFVVWIPGNIRKESVSKVTKHSKTIKQMNFWWINGARRASRSFLFFFRHWSSNVQKTTPRSAILQFLYRTHKRGRQYIT
jgi:hypothetical protein